MADKLVVVFAYITLLGAWAIGMFILSWAFDFVVTWKIIIGTWVAYRMFYWFFTD